MAKKIGVELNRIAFGLNEGAQTLQITTILTAAQVKALFTTPISLVPAAGAGTIIVVDRVTFGSTFVTPAYGGSNNLEFRYTGAAGAKVTADIGFATLNFPSGTQYSTVAGVTTELIPVANSPIVVDVPVANPTSGNSLVTVVVTYRILTLP